MNDIKEDLDKTHAESRVLYMHEYVLLIDASGRTAFDPAYFITDKSVRELVRQR